MSLLMRQIKAVKQVVDATFVVNGKLSFNKCAHQFACPEIAFQAAFKRGLRNNRLFERKLLFFSQQSRFRANCQAAKSLETFCEIQFEVGIDGVLI